MLHYPFLINTDYIDRGKHDFECLMLLLSLKVMYPEKIILLRGNHEWRAVSTTFGGHTLLNSIERLYPLPSKSKPISDKLFEVFSYLSLACVVNKSILCVHGGIPRAFKKIPKIHILDYYRALKKPIEGEDAPHGIESDFIVYDTVWSDPVREDDSKCRPAPGVLPSGFRTSFRDCNGDITTCTFEMETLNEFLEEYKLRMLIRAHECEGKGCYVRNSCKMITVFSSSGYKDGNTAGVLLIFDGTIRSLKMSDNPCPTMPQSYTLW